MVYLPFCSCAMYSLDFWPSDRFTHTSPVLIAIIVALKQMIIYKSTVKIESNVCIKIIMRQNYLSCGKAVVLQQWSLVFLMRSWPCTQKVITSGGVMHCCRLSPLAWSKHKAVILINAVLGL